MRCSPKERRNDLDSEKIDAEIVRIRTLGGEALRSEWRRVFKKDPPKALTKDILARMLAWDLQEKAYGGHDRATLKLLDSYARGKPVSAERLRRLRPGTVLVREYQGDRHTVTVAVDGFIWNGATYASLSQIAAAITGTSWNGPRFFGLRPAKTSKAPEDLPPNTKAAHPVAPAKNTERMDSREEGV